MASASVIIAIVAMALSIGLSQARTHPTDIEALRELKEAIDPSSIYSTSCLGSWDFSSDPCDALSSTVFVCGFQCTIAADQTLRITSISLDGSGYTGPLSPYVGNVSSLQLLDISNNAFYGSIPDSISRLVLLSQLDLSRNSFTGSIPTSIGQLSSLQLLSVSNNLLEGAIPASINSLVSLERLYVFNNRLSGNIPAMDKLDQLRFFDASNNLLSGSVSASLPPSLMQLSLRGNRLQGSLPDDLISLQELEVMDLSSNSFCDAVYGALFQLPSLQQLNLSNNKLTAITIPEAVDGGSSQLVAVDISYNRIRGQLPLFLVEMKRLSALSLRHNFLSGAIPIEYGLKAVASLIGAQPLMRLYLDGNYLMGEIPAPFLTIIPGGIAASFVDNCLLSCPLTLPFCQGGSQKSHSQCKDFNSVP
ncbi:hypothetical protein O6H91_16G090100 [Diphasiastrum complanatum]|uniref:Uncharacterized protein n=1 Tax=Diphasiastrum complanatum TaxID=34168 RepID=A0ACC2BEJ2_DIPCM|nr:hypothetical protein O6H91_Y409800 [Diphasiastrum complanatum]KAJ7528216.1 hypothetical protein O6H91_16G090100 [Diphasiastrum complanatum]